MATISNPNLDIKHDHTKRTARVLITANLNFTEYELSQMRQGLRFKLQAKLWGADSGFNGGDDSLYTLSPKYYPDSTPSATEKVSFDVTLGEGVLDEDLGTDEVYARLTLVNLYTQVAVVRKTNEISHNY